MSKSMETEFPTFSLETDDRTDDERAKSRQVKKPDRLVSALGMGSSAKDKAPMDTDYQEEFEVAAPKVKINLNFAREIQGLPENEEERNSKRFDIKRLFEAVSAGDVMKLEGLHQYLHQSLKKLTNTEC
ncbi:hypothetical protein DPEC_G00225240 [Dallia pectoralis]|uniref:Uncharacterized protein n=2 Tax=Dallia pectoralis TaxID=75939 RepID=A0ACC2G0P9_DALPE|nr:hypothetical protein DPEC_G00225220 [Dallia pectoralis]KAJ7997083.1 hypothetical protein DPEC_G00225240 [Dallia pectoralis]